VPRGSAPRTKRVLVAWFRFSLNGSIGRFVQVARALGPFGHHVGFLSLSGERRTDWPDFPGLVLTLEEARAESWDAVMIPGAGNPADPIELLAALKDPVFGLRVQHILNDPSRSDRFALVNRTVQPHLVVFNNSHWSPADYRRLGAEGFFTLPGAVDREIFYPQPRTGFPTDPPHVTLGGFAGKSAAAQLAALRELPEDHVLHLYGNLPPGLRQAAHSLLVTGRLVLHGPLFGEELAAFYRKLDVMIAAEENAGWCNGAAEAMACGVPCVVTRHGTVDFAVPGENAVVIEAVSAGAIAAAVHSVTAQPERHRRLARAAAATMRRFSWTRYSADLLRLLDAPRHGAYFRAPELGLFGKWEPTTRLAGLEPVLEECRGATLLDLGAAEGIISCEFAKRGANLVHAFELDASRVAVANELLAKTSVPEHVARKANLADWDRFARENADILEDAYDIVLFLGLYHHLPSATRGHALERALALTSDWFALRTPSTLARKDDLVGAIRAKGFRLVQELETPAADGMGWLGLFRRGVAE
jgi:hypothetical protein